MTDIAVAEPVVPMTLKRLLASLTQQLEEEEIEEEEWEDAFEQALGQYHLAAYAHGAGLSLRALTPEDLKVVEEYVKQQVGFLKGFVRAWKEGRYTDRDAMAQRRAEMYASATIGSWWMGHTRGWPLPAWPGDGTTQCKTNCRCSWDVRELDGEGNADAYWLLGRADHCQTCAQRAEDWAPVHIRGGVLQLDGVTTKGWVTIHGHPVLIGAPGSGGGGGGGGGSGHKTSQHTSGPAGGAAASQPVSAADKAQAKLTETNNALAKARESGNQELIKELEAERVRNHGALYRARKAEKGEVKPVVAPPLEKPKVAPPTPAVEAIKAEKHALKVPGVIRGSDHVQAEIDKLRAQRKVAKDKGDQSSVETLEAEIRYQTSRKYRLTKLEAREDEKKVVADGNPPIQTRAALTRKQTNVSSQTIAQKLNELPTEYYSAGDFNKDTRLLTAQAKYRDVATKYGVDSIWAKDAQVVVQKTRTEAIADAQKSQAKGRTAIMEALKDRPSATPKIKIIGEEHLIPSQRAELHEGIAFFNKVVGGGTRADGGRVSITIHPGAGRGYAKGAEVHLYALGHTPMGEITVHELGHWYERQEQKVAKRSIAFVDRRTQGEKPQRLSDLKPHSGYDPSEIAKPDRFFNPYVGRIYPFSGKEASEVTSMVMQEMYARPQQLLRGDPDMFHSIWESITR